MTADKLALTAAGTIALIASLNASDPLVLEIPGYPDKTERKMIREVKFEPAEKKLFRVYSGSTVSGKGIDGSFALKLERNDDRTASFASISLPPIPPGADCAVEVMVKGENIRENSHGHKFYCLSTESRVRSTGEKAHWRDGTTRLYSEIPGKDFSRLSMDFKGKKGLQPFVLLGIPAGFQGTVYFDDLKIYRNGLPATLKLTAPALRIFRTGNGKFEVNVTPAKVSDPVLLAILHRNNKILRSVIVRPDPDHVYRGDFGKGLEPGNAGLRLIFADAAAKVKLGMLETGCRIEELPD